MRERFLRIGNEDREGRRVIANDREMERGTERDRESNLGNQIEIRDAHVWRLLDEGRKGDRLHIWEEKM